MDTSYYTDNTVYDDIANEATLLAATQAAATAAAASLASTQVLFSDFDKRYLGAFSSAPALDNEGAALQAGALYYDTTLHAMQVYGSSWGSLTSGVATFNGRAGAVVPTTGDYAVANVTGAAPLASPALTGTPTAPTAAAATNTTQIATTAFVEGEIAAKAPLASPALTGTPTAPTAAVDTNTTQIATTAMVLAQAAAVAPSNLGTAAVGTSTRFARADHVHAGDASTLTAGTLPAARIGAASLDLTTKVTGILPAANGGTGNGFYAVSGPATSTKTYTFPNVNETVVCYGTAGGFTAHQGFPLAALTDGASIAWDVSTKQKAAVTLGGNRTMSAVSNAVEGYTYYLWVIQDGTGSRTLSWTTSGAGGFDFGLAGAPTLTTAASKGDLICFEAKSIGGTLKLRYMGICMGFA